MVGVGPSEQPTGQTIGVQIDERFAELVRTETLELLALRALAGEPLPAPHVEIGIVIAGDEELHRLNREYRAVDSPTDVLSFSNLEGEVRLPDAPDIPIYLGDVIVSYPRAAVQAADAGHGAQDELALLVVHGVLHLLGYDHDDPERKAAMWRRQEEVLGKRLVD